MAHLLLQEPDVKGVSVTNTIEYLATCVFWEARLLAGLGDSRARGWLHRLVRGWSTRSSRRALSPNRFHFYQHTAPNSSFREDFDRVVLDFIDGEFRYPKWEGYKIIPAAIQQARFECARDVSAGEASVRPERQRLTATVSLL